MFKFDPFKRLESIFHSCNFWIQKLAGKKSFSPTAYGKHTRYYHTYFPWLLFYEFFIQIYCYVPNNLCTQHLFFISFAILSYSYQDKFKYNLKLCLNRFVNIDEIINSSAFHNGGVIFATDFWLKRYNFWKTCLQKDGFWLIVSIP